MDIFWQGRFSKQRLKKLLASSDLRGVDLSGNFLDGYDLSDRDLTGSSFRKARIRDSSFRDADLSSIDFTGARLENSDFTRARLHRSRLQGVVIVSCDFSGADMTEADLSLSVLQQVAFEGANLEGARFLFSKGLTTDIKNEFKCRGARVAYLAESWRGFLLFLKAKPWLSVPLAGLILAGILFLWTYYGDIEHRSLNSLEAMRTEARQARRYEEVRELDTVLERKYLKRGNRRAAFAMRLDSARMARLLGRPVEASQILDQMLTSLAEQPDETALIHLETAAVLKEAGRLGQAIALLEETSLTDIDNNTRYRFKMYLAGLYREKGHPNHALPIYEKLGDTFKEDEERHLRILRNTAGAWDEMGNLKKGGQIRMGLPIQAGRAQAYLNRQMRAVEVHLSEQNPEAALAILNDLAEKLEGRPDLLKTVNERRKQIAGSFQPQERDRR